MSARRRPGCPVRQLSLQQSAATASRRPLRKQQSIDADRRLWSSGNGSGDAGLRVTASSMATSGHLPHESASAISSSGMCDHLPQECSTSLALLAVVQTV
jgi:hypothetical protein